MSEYIYVCDSSIEGLLSGVYESYYSKDNVFDIIVDGGFQGNFIYTYKHIKTNSDNAHKVSKSIKKKISNYTFTCIINTWLSETPLCGHHILKYIQLGFSIGSGVNDMLTQENVAFVHKMYQKVAYETHRFLGLCRFSKMANGTYLSIIATDNNILPLIADHFATRLATEKLIMYDEKRKNALLSNKGKWIIVNDVNIETNNFSKDEFEFRKMWKRYFNTIAIKERTNKKLQRQFVPVRYWDNIIELKD